MKIKNSLHIKPEDLIPDNSIKINEENIQKNVKGKTILVTGGAGSIGSELVLKLFSFNPKSIIVVDQAETPLHNLIIRVKEKLRDVHLHSIIGDIRNKGYLNYIFKKYNPDIVYHCAAYKHLPMMESNPFEAVSVNIEGTKILSDLSIKYDIDRFILISTDKAVYPTSIMGVTKFLAESYIQNLHKTISKKKTKFFTVRFGNVIGSNGSVFELFKRQIEKAGPLTITHPEVSRYFISLDEVSDLTIEASCLGKDGDLFIFDMGSPIKVIDLAKRMILLSKLDENNIKLEFIGLRPGEKLSEKLLHDDSFTKKTSHLKILKVILPNNSVNHSIIEEIIEISKTYNRSKLLKTLKGVYQSKPN